MGKKTIRLLVLMLLSLSQYLMGQNIITIDTTNWDIRAKSYVIEKHLGKDAIYIQNGGLFLKNANFLNGTIEFDIFLKKPNMFPGVFFRGVDNFKNGEQWYIRTHLSGKPDANQAAASINGVTPWQLYFGPKYSFPYNYKYDDWTHVKLVVNDDKAQVFLDYSEKPNLSWHLFHKPMAGDLMIRGGGTAMHIANIIVNKEEFELVNFKPVEREPIEGLIWEWEISDMFEKKLLNDPTKISSVIENRSWGRKIKVEEGTAANISRQQTLYNGKPGETVFAKISIESDRDQTKLFQFGYSDEVIAILNGKPIYQGTNKWRSRDYRYLGTVGLFDAIYLNLKKGKNTLYMAVSESFGGWLITGKFNNNSGIRILD